MPRVRSALLLALTLVLILGAAPNSLADEDMAGQEVMVDASWMFPKAQPGYFTGYMVLAVDRQPTQGPDVGSFALVFRGPCHREENYTECTGKYGAIYDDLKPGQVRVAEDWSSANLELGKGKKRVSLAWTPELLLWPTWTGSAGASESSDGSGYEYETEGFGISRDASVEGTMFGRSLGAEGLEDASFYRGDYRGTYSSHDRSITIGSVRWLLPAS